jgi:cytochrome c5
LRDKLNQTRNEIEQNNAAPSKSDTFHLRDDSTKTGRNNMNTMRILINLFIIVGLITACTGDESSQEVQPTAKVQESEEITEPPPSIDGVTLLNERCNICHTLDRIEKAKKSRADWERTVALMVNKGARLEKDEQAILIDYLAETFR